MRRWVKLANQDSTEVLGHLGLGVKVSREGVAPFSHAFLHHLHGLSPAFAHLLFIF